MHNLILSWLYDYTVTQGKVYLKTIKHTQNSKYAGNHASTFSIPPTSDKRQLMSLRGESKKHDDETEMKIYAINNTISENWVSWKVWNGYDQAIISFYNLFHAVTAFLWRHYLTLLLRLYMVVMETSDKVVKKNNVVAASH